MVPDAAVIRGHANAVQRANMFERAAYRSSRGRSSLRLQLLVAAAFSCGGVLASPTGKHDNDNITVENVPTVSKRQINIHNGNFNQRQIAEDYVDYVQQTNAASNQFQQFEQQQTGPQELISGLQSDALPPTTTTTLSPFGAEQVRLQTEYAHRAVAEQLTNEQRRSRPRTFAAQPAAPLQLRPRPVPPLQQQLHGTETPQFLDQNWQPPRQRDDAPDHQRDVVVAGPAPGDESSSFSYAHLRFGGSAATAEPAAPARPKGQRSVSRPDRPVPEPVVQQTVDRPATVFPIQFSPRLLQNVVYVQPNGQIHKPIEDAERVVEIPRRSNRVSFFGRSPSFGPVTATPTPTDVPAETGGPLRVLVPRPKKPADDVPAGPHNVGQDGRKTGRAQKPRLQATRPAQPQQQRLFPQLQPDAEPDNFLASLLYRLQQQQQQEDPQERPETVPTARAPKQRGDYRPDASKYLPDRNQLQLLQFPHELQSLSGAELRALQENAAGAQPLAAVAADDDDDDGRFVELQRKRLPKGKAVAKQSTTESPQSPAEPQLYDGHGDGHFSPGARPVPTAVELSDEQRQFLAAQGIRNLYRVDYDQSGNALPLTYVLALDNRPKRAGQPTTATDPTEKSSSNQHQK